MAQTNLFKRAYVRGINDELVRLGALRYPSKTAADEVADGVAEMMPVDPAVELAPEEAPAGIEGAPGAGVSPDTAAEVAATLVESAQQLMAEAGPPAMPGGEVPVQAPEEALKTSAAADLNTRASMQAEAVMVKAASEVKRAMGSTIEGGDKGNTLADAIAGESVMEARNRPAGMYNLGVGNTQYPVGEGAVGTEQVPAPNAPAEDGTGASSNSIIEQAKAGSWLNGIIHKLAMGATIEGGDKGNTLTQAAGVTGEAKIEADRRPDGYATNSLGQTALPVTPAAVVGTEQDHPDMPGERGTGASSNSVTEHTDKAAFVRLFKKTASSVAHFLPEGMSDAQKIAHVRQMMGQTTAERNIYLGSLHKNAGTGIKQAMALIQAHSKAAEDMPEALAAAMVGKEEECDKDKKDKKDEKDEKEKEAGLDILARIREFNTTLARR